jgi:multidrug resistance efflux pump
VRGVRSLYASSDQARANLHEYEADVLRLRYKVAEAKAERARAEFKRREALVAQGFASPENAENAKSS